MVNIEVRVPGAQWMAQVLYEGYGAHGGATSTKKGVHGTRRANKYKQRRTRHSEGSQVKLEEYRAHGRATNNTRRVQGHT